MLKSLDYVDPHLAERIHRLEGELTRLEQSKRDIMSNATLLPTTRTKLLRYQAECEDNARALLSTERDKLGDYLDHQTNLITKTHRQMISAHSKHNATFSQSTRIDFSSDEAPSMDTGYVSRIPKFMLTQNQTFKRPYANKNRVKVRRLKSKVEKQQKVINMLVTWVKIYHEKEVASEEQHSNYNELEEQNREYIIKIKQLEQQLSYLRDDFKQKSLSILSTHRQYKAIKQENQELQMQRKELLRETRSKNKSKSTFIIE